MNLDDIDVVNTPEFQEELQRRIENFRRDRGREPGIRDVPRMFFLLLQLSIERGAAEQGPMSRRAVKHG